MRKQLLITLLAFIALGQVYAQSIKGRVEDNKKEPVIGATVLIEGTKQGAITDALGAFEIKNIKPGDYKLRISGVGYVTTIREISVSTNGANVLVSIKTDTKMLDEAVVVGYGVQRKREVTGSVGKITGKELNDMPVPSFESALQGKLAGVTVTTGSGLAGSAAIVRIRGVASISAAGDPLYVVDGIAVNQDYSSLGNGGGFNQNPLSSLNPNDIESIDVLKDAAATSIYGSRGSNGVILITTKRAKGNGLVINYDGQIGTSSPTALPNMTNSQQFLQLYKEAWINDGRTGNPDLKANGVSMTWDQALKSGNNTNWLDYTTRTGVKQQHNITIQKGSKYVKASGVFGYSTNESFLVGNSFDRLSGRLNMDFQITKKLSAILSSSYSQGTNNRVYSGWSGGFGQVMSSALPIYPVRNADGSYFLFKNGDGGGGDIFNPVMIQDLYKWRTIEKKAINGITFDWKPVKNLTLKASGNYDYTDLSDQYFTPQAMLKMTSPSLPGVDTIPGYAYGNSTYTNNYNYLLQANYSYELNKINKFDFMAGHEYQRTHANFFNQQILSSTPLWDNQTITTANINTNPRNNGGVIDRITAFLGYFGRVNYNLKDKIFLQLSGRVDGSSKFGANNRYAFLPAASVGYILTEEKFLKGNKFINFLKVRYSYGKSGNSAFEDYARFGTFSAGNSQINYNGNNILFPTKLENKDLKWETSWTSNYAIDFGLFNDRINGTIEYYDKKTEDVIMNLTISSTNGFGSYYDNVGGIRNRGVEFNLNTKNTVGKFKWSTNFNIARNINELTSTGSYTQDAVSGGTNDTRAVVGSPVGTYYIVRFSRVDPADGRPIYLDKDGKETKTWDVNNRVPVGAILPDAVGSVTNRFEYKNFDFSFMVYFQLGGKIYDASAKRQMGVTSFWNYRTDIADRWQKPGDIATFPRLTLDPKTYGLPDYWQYNTTMWLYDASFARLRNVTIGYRIPNSVTKKIHIASARLAIIGTNLLTFTKYPGLDPEIARDGEGSINASRNMQSQGTFYLNAPQEKTFTFQVSINF